MCSTSVAGTTRQNDDSGAMAAKCADVDEWVERDRQRADDHAGDRQPADATDRPARQPAFGEREAQPEDPEECKAPAAPAAPHGNGRHEIGRDKFPV